MRLDDGFVAEAELHWYGEGRRKGQVLKVAVKVNGNKHQDLTPVTRLMLYTQAKGRRLRDVAAKF